MDISAQGEILPSSSISQQLIGPSTPSLAEDDMTSMSSTVESVSTQMFHPETERGYKGSPMAHLISQYKASSDDNISTYQRAVHISAKKTLFDNEVVELQGLQKSYMILLSLWRDITQVVNELQVF